MRVYLIRHAQSTNNALADFRDRVVDPDLTPLGYEQIQRLGEWLKHSLEFGGKPFGFTHLITSPMLRALLTANAVAQATGLTLEVTPDVAEGGGMFLEDKHTGVITGYTGMTRSEILARFPHAQLGHSISEAGWWNPEMGRESEAHCAMRAIRVAHSLVHRSVHSPEERVVIVTHGLFMDTLVKALLHQLPAPANHLFYTHYNTGITRFDLREGDELRLHYLNRVDHLPADKRTW